MWQKRASTLPETGLASYFEIKSIDTADVAKYRRFFDGQGQHVPLTYFYLLAQRAQIALMLDSRFPHPIPGLIHAGNELQWHGQLLQGLPLEIAVSVVSAQRFDDAKSVVFSVEMTQCGRRLVSCISEYRIPRSARRIPARHVLPESFPETFLQAGWLFEQSVSRRYAMLSGDFNPIHLSSILARTFGFRRAIAHGMYAIGRAAVSIEHHTGKPLKAINARFKRPILVASQAIFGLDSTATTQGDFGILLVPDHQLAISGTWSH